MVSPLEMYSKFGLANQICSAKWDKLVRKWPMADCYFKLWYNIKFIEGSFDNKRNTIKFFQPKVHLMIVQEKESDKSWPGL